VLYGGTAIALRLAHRQSQDLDLFSSEAFAPDDLCRHVPLLERVERLQSEPNTLTVSLERGAPVKLSFFGGLKLARVGTPDRCADNGLYVASLVDLAATKMAVVQHRAEKKDYLDIYAILRTGISLEEALGAAVAVYGRQFNPAITLKALTWFRDGDLPSIPAEIQAFLARKAAEIGGVRPVPGLSDSLTPS
jgi:hypothetical protein